MNDICPIWGTSCQKIAMPRDRDAHGFNSSRAGGKYIVTGTAYRSRKITALDELSKMKLSRWIYEQNQLGETPEIYWDNLKEAETWPMPSALEQMDYCLQFLESKIEAGWRSVEIESHLLAEMQAATLTLQKNNEETRNLMQEIKDLGWIETGASVLRGPVKIRRKGYQRLIELRKTNVASDQVFVAMWLDPSMDKTWEEGFEPGIRNAGYKALRIDRSEFNNKIDDEIIAEIRRSRFLVADFTSDSPENARGSVYYEAGFAHGLNIPVIFTCRKDLLEDIHFDTRQYNHIPWEEEKPEDLRKQLKDRISATIGDGPHRDENP